jgi:signal peptidase I
VNAFLKKKNHKKLREQAENWLRLAEKVYHFRKDIISEEDMKDLHDTSSTLNKALKKKGDEDWGKVRLASEELESVLSRKKVGGYFYPQSFWAENAEMFLVAAIVALAIRAFFLQPFKIPTNSMFPSYNGMTHEVYEDDSSPGGAGNMLRFLSWGTLRRDVVAPDSGEVLVPVRSFERVPGRKFFLFPTTLNEFTIRVGDEETTFTVPGEFYPFEAFKDAYFPGDEREWSELLQDPKNQSQIVRVRGRLFLRTGKEVNQGDLALSFAIHTGDALFVDRISYHFKRPDVGEAVVFKTENIPTIEKPDKYYIKRLVGVPGDELQVKAPGLYRNGELITGAPAFAKNAIQEEKYPGYSYRGLNRQHYLNNPNATVTIPEDSFFAMGDNSPHSSDSRYWGFVPKREMVGKAMFIYYPFTHRWGIAK